MFDLSLFRKPTFGGASIAAFALSASMFAMFLYLTLYLQTILGYGPLETGLRFLPVTLLSFVAAAVSGKLTARLPARGLLGGGLLLVAAGLLLMRGVDAQLGLDGAAARLRRRGHRDRHDQPVDRQRGDRRRRAGARRDGVGHQLDVSPGRHRDRHRGPRRGLPEPGHEPPRSTRSPARRARRRRTRSAAPSRRAARRRRSRRRRRRPGRASSSAIDAAFTSALNDLLLIAAVVAIAGGLLALALVRGSDFVVSAPRPRRGRQSRRRAARRDGLLGGGLPRASGDRPSCLRMRGLGARDDWPGAPADGASECQVAGMRHRGRRPLSSAIRRGSATPRPRPTGDGRVRWSSPGVEHRLPGHCER